MPLGRTVYLSELKAMGGRISFDDIETVYGSGVEKGGKRRF
jgi:hypothetical protein